MATDNTQDRINAINDADVRHGLDDDPNNDAEKGAALGGLGGALTGAAAGSIAGPIGTIVGAIAGGLVGAGASGAAVAAIDAVDNDNTVTGVGTGVSTADPYVSGTTPTATDVHGHNIVTGDPSMTDAGDTGLAGGAIVGGVIGAAVGGPIGAAVGGTLGSLAGGVAGDAAEATDEAEMRDNTNYIGTPGVGTVGTPGVGTVYPNDATMNTTERVMPEVAPMGMPIAAAPVSGDPLMGGTVDDGHNIVTGGEATTEAGDAGLASGAVVGGVIGAAVGGPVGAVVGGTLGSLAGGVAGDAAEAADEEDLARENNYSGGAFQATAAMNPAIDPMSGAVTDNNLTPSEQTDYRNVDEGLTSLGATGENADTSVLGVTDTPGVRTGSTVDAPGIQTGGRTTQGPDTRGLMEKTADAITGDNVDDKTGGRVINDPNNR